jgi:hypothetical protein
MGGVPTLAPARAAGYVWQLGVETEPTMHEPSAGSAGVVLLVPEALGETPDLEGLRRTLAGPPCPARVLLCLTGNAGHELVDTLAQLKLDFQILLAADAAPPPTKARCVHAPPGMSPDDQNEFALALCDVVLVGPGSEQHPVARTAVQLGKSVIAPGAGLRLLTHKAFLLGLDPESPGWRILRRINGRLEQAILELWAFGWFGWDRTGRAKSTEALRKCITWRRLPNAYFPAGKSPDRAAGDSSAKIVAAFEAMDRTALHGSHIHRDIIWFTYSAAAIAVLAAVVGVLRHSGPGIWAGLELTALVAVFGAVFWARATRLQDRWTACRLAAEQLRIARMSLPLLVLPPALATADTPQPGHSDDQIDFVALDEVKRVVRDQGLPQLDPTFSAKEAAEWVSLIVSDQVGYHLRNHRKLECAETRLRGAAEFFFYLALAVVIVHLVETSLGWHLIKPNWLLMATVVGPAFAAALHGAATRLGIVHRAALSEDVERELRSIDVSLAKFLEAPKDTPEAWTELREFAYAAANAMGRENTSWHGLVRRYRDELP